ncbi:MAG: sugar phosphate isomerase/epimerase family protein [Chthoniobacter sp.]|uniref:sugar phosphate isomerase/epimerase family protein n=1 Tax=Chthoniobacter sp. TaxID=2510640 RepID=UPI0032A2682A
MKLGLYIDIKHGAAFADQPFDFVEENVQTLLVPEEDEAAFRERLAIVRSLAKPVAAANRLLPADLKPVGPVVDEARLQRWGESVFRRAEEVGVKTIVWGSGGARRVPEGFSKEQAREQFLRAVASYAPLAERHGVLIVIEPVCRVDSNFIMSLADGADIVNSVGHPSVRLLADNFHMDIEGEAPSEIERFADILEHVHVSEIKGRAIPGTTDYDLRPYLRALKKAGYDKTLVIEPEWQDVNTQPALALKALRAQMADAGLN